MDLKKDELPHSNLMKSAIGKTLKDIRNNREMTQSSFAKHVGVSQSKISKSEKGKLVLDIIELLKMSHFLNIGLSCFQEKVYENMQEAYERILSKN